MYKCSNCNYTAYDATNFCTHCGAPMQYVQPTPVQPNTYISSNNQTAAVYYTQARNVPLAKKIVGMILSINAFILSIVAFIYTLLLTALDGAVGFVFFLIYGAFSFPPAIIGFCMSNSNISAGDTSKMSSMGKIFGLISIIILFLCAFIGLSGLCSSLLLY